MNWREFEERVPQIAGPGAERFQRAHLALLGTLRSNGWPRISPVEPLFISQDLVLGMIWQSMKALDLLRDPRCVLHSVVTHPDANEGEFKLQARAEPATKPDYFQHIRARWRIGPSAPVRVFTLDILSASITTYDLGQGRMLVKRWRPDTGTLEIARAYP